ncbi:hypothetical protein DPEC_G00273090 [Dallia pectoralis]|uniref:Uncharacterized protein n=1 Tax=Dallia pectoralis TaxID=75939 RepID=A0ACC2FPY4_DALPE|nr:hypothetical protein DPEC_G00273090 [Dallia pectoralis]
MKPQWWSVTDGLEGSRGGECLSGGVHTIPDDRLSGSPLPSEPTPTQEAKELPGLPCFSCLLPEEEVRQRPRAYLARHVVSPIHPHGNVSSVSALPAIARWCNSEELFFALRGPAKTRVRVKEKLPPAPSIAGARSGWRPQQKEKEMSDTKVKTF